MSRIQILSWMVLVVFAPGFVAAANVYKCTTKDGSVVVSNTPCAKGAKPDAKLSSGTGANPVSFTTECERVAATGVGLVQIAPKLTEAQSRAVKAESFGRLNSAGASRILAEIARDGVLRVCAYFPGGDTIETLIEPDGLVRRDGQIDPDDPALQTIKPRRTAYEICVAAIDQCRSQGSALDIAREECIAKIGECREADCCPKDCFDAYWKPPYDHMTGLAAMRATAACKRVQ